MSACCRTWKPVSTVPLSSTRSLAVTALGSNATNAAALLAGVLDSAMDAIITVDEQHTIVLFNGAAEQIFGYPRQEVLGRSLERLVPTRFRHTHVGHVDRFGRTGVTSRPWGAAW